MRRTNWIKLIGDDHPLPSGTVVEVVETGDNPIREYECDQVKYDTETGNITLAWVIEDETNPNDETFAAVYVDEPKLYNKGDRIFSSTGYSPDKVKHPGHYQRLQDKFGIEAWDILDEVFPHDPHLWNAGKYLLRAGLKEGASVEEDLRKLMEYVERRLNANG